MALQSSPVNADDAATASQYNNLRADLIAHTHDGSDTASLGAGSVGTTQLADASVTTAKIADANVTTAKIANASVTTAKIADANVTTAKIADDAVTAAKLADTAALKKIDEVTLSTDGSISFSNIPQTYRHLLLVLYLRTVALAVVNMTISMQFNSDSTAIYYTQSLTVSGTTVTGSEDLAASAGRIGSAPGNGADANRFATIEVLIPHYTNSTNHKSWNYRSTSPGSATTSGIQIQTGGGFWANTAAITAIGVLGVFRAGSVATLYGLPA